MKKVYQSIVCNNDGDCFRATVASILDLTLEQVPHFIRFEDNWNIMFLRFMKMMDWEYQGNASIRGSSDLESKYSINGYFLCTVPSATFKGTYHSVIVDINGNIVHDPNPNEKCLGLNIYDIKDKDRIYWRLFSKYNRPEDELW